MSKQGSVNRGSDSDAEEGIYRDSSAYDTLLSSLKSKGGSFAHAYGKRQREEQVISSGEEDESEPEIGSDEVSGSEVAEDDMETMDSSDEKIVEAKENDDMHDMDEKFETGDEDDIDGDQEDKENNDAYISPEFSIMDFGDGSLTPKLPARKRFKSGESLVGGLKDIASTLVTLVDKTCERMDKVVDKLGHAKDFSNDQRRVVQELEQMGLSTIERIIAAIHITEKPHNVQLFWSFNREDREAFVRLLARGSG